MARADAPLYLLDASSRFEQRLLERFVREHEDAAARDDELVPIPPSRRRRRRVALGALEVAIAADGDPELVPLRVVWKAPLRDGERSARLSDLLRLGDPRDPGALRQRAIARRAPDRCHVVRAEPARLSALRARWSAAGGIETAGLAEYVARQAMLALERAERRVRGTRYKVPRFVRDEILRRPAFRATVARLAGDVGRAPARAQRDAARMLREIAASHSPFVIDLVAHAIRGLYTRGYGKLRYDREQMAGIARIAAQHPVVFLPSHKSNLDHLVLQSALHENGLPPNHTAGGINMNFFPVGPLVRRSGVFFIRRTFKDDALYKQVLRSYVEYLVEKRFPLEWYIEGGRSRSGKLLPPRLGMLAYVVDAWRRGCADDVVLVPVSIAYDQIVDVGAYSHEQRGGAKRAEGFGWFVGVLRSLGGAYGDIHIRFGEAVSLRDSLGRRPETAGAPASADAAHDARGPDLELDDEHDPGLALHKLAFEVSVAINRATPFTPTSLVSLALLGVGDRALGVAETREAVRNVVGYVRERKLPVAFDLDAFDTDEGVCAALDALVGTGVLTRFDAGDEPVYSIGEDQELTAAYYRNSVVHYFTTGAIAELAVLAAAEADPDRALDAFWSEAMRLRDLLKFEFFFPDKARFRAELRAELDHQEPAWEARIAAGGESAQRLVQSFRPFMAHRALRPFLESYQVVADRLARQEPTAPVDAAKLVDECLGLGRQYRLQRRIHSADSISKVLFQSALELARNRGLVAPAPDATGADALAERRRELAAEIRRALRRVETIAALGAARRAGWLR